MDQLAKTTYDLIKTLPSVFHELHFIFVICVFYLNLHYRCLAEDSIKEVGLNFQVPKGAELSTFHGDHDSFVVCQIFLYGARFSEPGRFDATDSKYNFDGNLCTHLVFSYLWVSSTLDIIEDDDIDEIKKFRFIKLEYSHLKLLLEIRMESKNKKLTELVSSSEKRQTFINNMKTALRRLFLDGLLISYHIYYGAPQRFITLAHELRDEFRKEGLLIATEIHIWDKDALIYYTHVAEISRLFDFVTVVAYNFNIKNGIPSARHIGQLFSKENNDNNLYDNLKALLTYWQINPRNLLLKVLVGGSSALLLQNGTNTDEFPFGYDSETNLTVIDSLWRGGNGDIHWGYDEICSTALSKKKEWKMYWDDTAKAPFLTNNRRWISFESPKSIGQKTELANDLDMRGIGMVVNYDDVSGLCSNVTYPFLKTVNYMLKKTKSKRGSKLCSLFVNDDKSSSLAFKYEPVLSLSSHLLKIAYGDSTEINCTAEGSPPLELSWHEEATGKIIKNNSIVEILLLTTKPQNYCTIQVLTSTIKLKSVHSSEIYSCQVSYSNRTRTKAVTSEIQVVEAIKSLRNLETGTTIQPEVTSSSVTLIWIAAILFPSVLVGISTGSIVFIVLRRKKNDGLTEREIAEFRKGVTSRKDGCKDVQDPEDEPYDDFCELSNDEYNIDKTNILGSGAFGIVYGGQVKDVAVAVKTTKPGADKQYLKSLLSELKILIYVKQHPHIVNLMGAVTTEMTKGILYIFVELCPLGNLQDYLRKSNETFICSVDGTEENAVTVAQLFKWSFQIAGGLSHLSSKKLIHGDLAARNVLLYNRDTIKITDFGLSRKLYEYTTYAKKSQEPLPWRWMAIESLREMKFSIQSDVWSFGVTIWEIFSLGLTPYPGLSWSPDFIDKLEENMRMKKPKDAPDSLYKILLDCWKSNPGERPTPEDNLVSFSTLMVEHLKDEHGYLENEEMT